MTLKDRILANTFVTGLRIKMKVDRAAYADLCAALGALAQEWKGEKKIDKALMQDLYVLPVIVRGVADSLRGHRKDLADELDARVLDCLAE